MSPSTVSSRRAEPPSRIAPTLAELRSWPAAISVADASRAFGFSRSHGFELARRGLFPARVLRAGGRYLVVTESVISALSATSPADGAA